MKTIDIVSIAALMIIFFLIYEGGGGMKGWEKNFETKEESKESARKPPGQDATTPPSRDLKSFESDFEQGLPAEFSPRTPENFPSLEKLRQDLEYRRLKLEYTITQERQEVGGFDGPEAEKSAALSALSEKHRQAKLQIDQLHLKILNEYQKRREEEGPRNKDLR